MTKSTKSASYRGSILCSRMVKQDCIRREVLKSLLALNVCLSVPTERDKVNTISIHTRIWVFL